MDSRETGIPHRFIFYPQLIPSKQASPLRGLSRLLSALAFHFVLAGSSLRFFLFSLFPCRQRCLWFRVLVVVLLVVLLQLLVVAVLVVLMYAFKECTL